MSLRHGVTAWPLGLDVSKVAILGGTFDPPHRAHLGIARAAMDALGPDSGVVLVPACTSPFKVGLRTTGAEHRLAMARLAVRGQPRWGVWSDEIDRAREGEPSFMVETLERATSVTGGRVMLRLVLGADQVLRFHQWRDFRRIIKLARPLVVLRPPVGTVGVLREELQATGVWGEAEVDSWCARCVTAPLDDVSSTMVRAAVRTGVAGARGMVADDVLSYIGAHGLYRD